MPHPALDDALLDQLARVYMRAALDRLMQASETASEDDGDQNNLPTDESALPRPAR